MNTLNSYPTVPAETSPFINFADAEGIQLLSGEKASYAVLDEGVAYPESSEETELGKLLLPLREVEGKRLLELPENFATMGNALNDAISHDPSDRGIQKTRELFERVGTSLAQVALKDSVVPPYVSYKNFIFSRENGEPKLLPPIEFVKFQKDHKETAQSQVINALRKSLEEGAINTEQKRLSLNTLAGFIQKFEW